jgi:hypothetical protein
VQFGRRMLLPLAIAMFLPISGKAGVETCAIYVRN